MSVIPLLILIATLVLSVVTLPLSANASLSQDIRKQYDVDKNCATNTALVPNMEQFLTYFNCGHAIFYNNGTTLRQFTLIIEENHKIPITLAEDTQKPILFPAWTFNGSIPGPTMRMTKGDHVQVTVINRGTMPHSLHMHSIHPGNMDGVPIISGESGMIGPGKQFTYDFIADPVGIFPYHCHAQPLQEHINRGLYGGLIIDPPVNQARPPAQEIVMYLNGYDLNLKSEFPRMPTFAEANEMMAGNETVSESLPQEHDNQLYTVNGIANYYMHHPVPVKMGEPLRIYMYNMLDFEENSFHMHGQVFQYYNSGTSNNPQFTGDMIVLGQGDRGILETQFNYPGLYMAHSHLDQQASRGWSSLFSVK